MLDKSNIKDMYELSPMQKGMLFHALKDGSAHTHVVQGTATLRGEVDVSALEKSFRDIVGKYDVLRTVFIHEKLKQPLQVVLKQRDAGLYYEDLAGLDPEQAKHEADGHVRREREREFDFARDLLFRLSLLRTAPEEYRLIWTFHHILMDGWCLSLVFQDLFTLYRRHRKGEPVDGGRATPYSEYIRWLQKQDHREGLRYWEEYLKGWESPSVLPGSQGRIRAEKRWEEVVRPLDPALTDGLSRLAREKQTTVNTVFQTLWGILLQRYNQTEDVVFGSVVSGRPAQVRDVEHIVGLFINTVPVRVTLSHSEETFTELLGRVHRSALESKSYEYISLADIQRVSSVDQPVNHILVFENYLSSKDAWSDHESLGFRFEEGDSFEPSNYDFNLVVLPGENGWTLHVGFDPQGYDARLVTETLCHLEYLMKQAVARPDLPVRSLEVLDGEGKERVLNTFNPADAGYPAGETIHGLFEAQVKRTPDQVAVTCDEERWTYRQLNARANRLVHVLRREGVRPDGIVGILFPRSLDMVVAMLAVLKAGGAYLPIDPTYPSERIRYLLADSAAGWLLVPSADDAPPGYKGKVVLMDAGEERESDENPSPVNRSGDLAYILYTSGSTGKPKGVMVEHRNVVRLLFHDGNRFDFHAGDVWSLFHSTSFDFSVWEIYGALLYGGRLVVVPEWVAKDPDRFYRLLKEEKVTILNQTPTAFSMLAHEAVASEGAELSVRKVIFGGEALAPVQLAQWKRKYPGTQLINMYGITETTVHVTYKEIGMREIESNVSNIGRPIPTLKVYVLDERGQPLPMGVPGEMYVSGDGVARGYLNRPEWTEERFLLDPFDPEKRMYRSGDLARWLPDGELEYLGRKDHQVKIRGHRIELGEVTGRLLEHPYVQEGIVVPRQDVQGETDLIAYFVAGGTWSVAELRGHMGTALPAYMIPAHFMELDVMPLTSNGKIDRKALPAPRVSGLSRSAPPTNRTEEMLVRVYQEVLGVKSVGIHDHFLDLGGHSLKATQLAARIQKEWGKTVPLREIFLRPTPKELAAYIRERGSSDTAFIQPTGERKWVPASSEQRRLYVIREFENVGTSYNIPLALEWKGKLDVKRLRDALEQLIQRHEILRTSFHLVEGELKQRIHEQMSAEWVEMAGSGEWPEWVERFVQPFTLDRPPLFRAGLVEVEEERYWIFLDFHHIIIDGISMGVILHEWMELYRGKTLPVPPLQYKDYAVWQEEWRRSGDFREKESYWFKRLQGELPVLDLPTDFPRPPIQRFEGESVTFTIDRDLTDRLRTLAAAEGGTLFMTLLAAYQTLLHKYTGQEDILVGSPISGRFRPGLESMVGMFVNMLPLRGCPRGQRTFRQFLSDMRQDVLDAYEHAEYPLEELLDRLELQRDMSRQPLFDTVFGLQNMDRPVWNVPGVSISSLELEWNQAKFDLTWEISDGETLAISLEYNRHLFARETIDRMVRHFLHISRQVVERPDTRLTDIQLVTPAEKERLLAWNRTDRDYPRHRTIQECFEEAVQAHGEREAIIHASGTLTYRELNDRANRLARLLRDRGVHRGSRVALMTVPSPDTVVAILAVLKAGGAYVPIDPAYPGERIRYQLEDSGAGWVLTHRGLSLPSGSGGMRLELDGVDWDKGDASNLEPVNTSDDPAYIIYTSGSTGRPKGVLLHHRGVQNLSLAADDLGLKPGSRSTQLASFSFDASVWEVFPPLLTGATIVMGGREAVLERTFTDWLRESAVTHLMLPPSLLRSIPRVPLPDLEVIVTGGEACTPELVEWWGKNHRFFNAYGPTEITVCATMGRCRPGETVTIGKPLANTRAYVMGLDGQLCPVGVPGELWVGGDGVGLGYLDRPELTAERFVPDPFKPGERVYRTGDWVRRLPDGSLAFMGRMDDQVKIRGHRVELGEIKARLTDHPDVKETAVMVRFPENGHSELCAYIVSAKGALVDEIREFLSRSLPGYMVPAHVIDVESIPLTLNGKVDFRALPEPGRFQLRQIPFEGPRNPEEALLCWVWEEVLSREKVGIRDHFFEIGGDSIKGIQAAARMGQEGWRLRLKDLFQHPTIAELARRLEPLQQEEGEDPVEGEVPLTPIQHWVFGLTDDPKHWNQAVMLHHEQGWDADRVKRVFHKLVHHHDALRMVFRRDAGRVKQFNRGTESAEQAFTMEEYDCTQASDPREQIGREAERLQRSLQLEGPLIRLGLFRTGEGDHLLVIIHHLVVDAVSWRILMEDFETAYEQDEQGKPVFLPAKTSSFQRWSTALQEYANSPAFLEKELPYWTRVLCQEVRPLPADRKRQGTPCFNDMAMVDFTLGEKETTRLLREKKAAYGAEINDLLLAGWARSVREWTGADRIAVDLEGHGREDLLEGVQVTRTVGWFTASFPVLLDTGGQEWESIVSGVKKALNQTPNKGVGYSLLRYLTDADKRGPLTVRLRPEMMFNYLGEFRNGLAKEEVDSSTMPVGELIDPNMPWPYAIDINGFVVGNRLTFTLRYDRHRFHEETMRRLTDRYVHHLRDLARLPRRVSTP
ncbi:non-ribosomal peptide synthetase [Desmospora profundinema]|uniref:Amino acid adenylation domain-containing protein/non-ribosomal peptide synthase protein (TIGR01720 family) n=1 Tax=Desmospora profundinema TaxID=1571184 RepID=A0ABU1IQ72_9BACL|nr:non-ribosomal peptide synthetase [Desmospora profundinema]MDR6226883.1 amino acid adenylation domain-containing protein/non-ribosomal peptide synthase protein (TIGR01720 family) [Desmospora profundinema]